MLTQEKQQRNWKPIIKQFEAVVGKNGVVQRREELLTYECDGLTSYRQRPALVVLPRTTEQVAEAVKICDQNQIPWVARGAGTGSIGWGTTRRKLRFDCYCFDEAHPRC